MPYQLEPFADVGLTEARLRRLVADHEAHGAPALRRRWDYYRNPRRSAAGPDGAVRRGGLAQERGLPARLRPGRDPLGDDREREREVVIENDIAWRIHASIDFLLARPARLESAATDEAVRERCQAALDAMMEASGGAALLHDVALLGAVYGHVDLALRAEDLFAEDAPGAGELREAASLLRVEPLEPTRAVAMLDPSDYRVIRAMIVRTLREDAAHERTGALERAFRRVFGAGAARPDAAEVVEVLSASRRQVYEGERLVHDAPNPLGELPVVHVQNLAQPFAYEGMSDVEPLIPLQDELNTRLSDRAHRVSMQAFKMYLAKGVEALSGGAGALGVGPGQVWTTDNPDAEVIEFGGDGDAPGESAHIDDVRAALDKASGVTPLAAGMLGGRVGNLSSENALRVTLMGMTARAQRKQHTYGRALERLGSLALGALDRAGVLPTTALDRTVRVRWSDPVPRSQREELEVALLKLQAGVSRERVLAELGYALDAHSA